MSGEIDETRRKQFESGWATGNPTPIDECLPDPESPLYSGTLEELVHVELEFGWRRGEDSGTGAPRVERYLERFPLLARPDILLRLLRQEYSVRHRFGDRPPVEEYARRFPAVIVDGAELGSPPEPDARRGFTSGEDLGRYQLIEEHARGGFGAVWRARDEKLGREIALKRLSTRLALLPDFRGRFIHEARTTAGLEHPGIVPVYDLSGAGDEHAYYAMKLVRGGTLADAIERCHGKAAAPGDRAVEERRLLGAFLMVCQTMKYAHARGVIHRDLKPQNIVLGDYGETVILDWGLAKELADADGETAGAARREDPDAAGGDRGATRHGTVQGTPAYMSPEQAAGRTDEVGRASDIYSLGVILYQLLTGRVPFRASTEDEVLARVIEGSPVPPRTLAREVHPALGAVCLKAMAVAIEDRYASVAALTGDLQRFLADEPVAAFTEPWRIRAGRWVRRHRALVTGLVAAGLVALVGLAAIAVILAASNRREQAGRDRAEANFDLAREAVDRYCIRVSEHPKLRAAGFEDLRKELYQAATGFYEEFVRRSAGDPAVRRTRARSLINLALIVRDTESPEKSVALYEEAITILRDLVERAPGQRERMLMLAAAHHDLGTTFRELGRRERAEAQYRETRALYERVDRLHPDRRTPPKLRGLLLFNLSDACSARGDLAEAERLMLRAIENLERVVDRPPEAGELPGEMRWQLAKCHHNRALLYIAAKLNRPADHEASLRKALEICRALIDEYPTEPNYRMQLCLTLHQLGTYFEERGRLDEAASFFTEGLEMSRRLAAAHPGVPTYASLLAWAVASTGALEGVRGDPASARRLLGEALALREKLVDRQPTVPMHAIEVAKIHSDLAYLHAEAGEREEAADGFDRAAKGHAALAHRFPAELEHTEEAGIAWFQAGQVASQLGDGDRALARLGAAVPLLERALARGSSYEAVPVTLRRARAFRAWLLSETGRFEAATPDWERLKDLGAEGVYPPHLERAARKMARAAGEDAGRIARAALAFALAAGAAGSDRATMEGCAAAAVRLLEAARRAGWFGDTANLEMLRHATGFAPLRDRDDYRALLERVTGSRE